MALLYENILSYFYFLLHTVHMKKEPLKAPDMQATIFFHILRSVVGPHTLRHIIQFRRRVVVARQVSLQCHAD